MEKGHEKMYRVLKNEQEKHFSPRERVQANYWDSTESDTESLAQERAYQQQLQMRIYHHEQSVLPQNENDDCSQQEEDEDLDNDEAEDLQVFDSLEAAALLCVKKNPALLQSKYLDTKSTERQQNSQVFSDDVYSDLRYDPNWRRNLKGAGRFNESPHISIDENDLDLKETSCQSSGDRKEVVMKEGYKLIVDTSPAAVVTPKGNESDQSYHLHPQDGQTSSVTSPHPHSQTVQLRPPEVDLPVPPRIQNKSDRNLQRRVKVKHEINNENTGENNTISAELAEHLEDVDALYIQEMRSTQGEPTRQINMSKMSSPKDSLNKKQERPMDDIVERNKITLGRNTSKCGSYAQAHALKQEVSPNSNKVREPPTEIFNAESEEDISNPEEKWLQKTQQLKVTRMRKGKKAERKESSNPLRQHQPPAPGVKAEQGDCLRSPLTKPAAKTQLTHQNTNLSQPLPPAIHLNINLNTSSHLPPFLQHESKDSIISLVSFHGHPHLRSGSEVQLASSPGYQRTSRGKSSKMFQEGLNTELNQWNVENFPGQWQRVPALKGPLSCVEEDQKWSYNEIQTAQFTENLPMTPTSTLSQGSGSYKVLPPIGRPGLEKVPELSPDQSVNTSHPIQRRVSDGYLVQMEKQKNLRTRATYKAYSLKDYRQLKPDVTLQGLGPDYTAIEQTKMRRQKLYSNVIREQNKKISRIPFLPAKDPEADDKKVPRMKALEYAKTIAKPPLQIQSKMRQKHHTEGFTEHAPYLKGLDVTQLATLELLRKRHEEEKQAVALFRKIHTV